MNIYIAARAKFRAEEVKAIQERLKEMGHDVTYDWPANNHKVRKPYREPENRKFNLAAQEEMLRAAALTDVFIFLDDPGLRGAYIELGAFLYNCLENSGGRRAYIVGPDSHEREFIFESPEYVIFADTIDEVFEDLVSETD
jgi:hypothetical protein